MGDTRRRLMMQSKGEGLDYLTIIVDTEGDDSARITVSAAAIERYDEYMEDYAYEYLPFEFSRDNGQTWYEVSVGKLIQGEGTFEIYNLTGPIKLRANYREHIIASEELYFMPPNIDCMWDFTVEGTPMSLIYGDNFEMYSGEVCWPLYGLFNNSNIKRINNPKTFLPATSSGFTLSDNSFFDTGPAYKDMFYGCSHLENAPDINLIISRNSDCYNMFYLCENLREPPAIHTQKFAYDFARYMFYGCYSLEEPPEFTCQNPILGDNCFSSMFYGCTALKRAPVLYATELSYGCYANMFAECKSLSYIKMMAINVSSSSYYLANWVRNVSKTGTFVANKNKKWDTEPGYYGYSGVPSGWTVITE